MDIIKIMKKLLFRLCLFGIYQIFIFCLINVVVYQYSGVKLSWQESSFIILFNILFISCLVSFYFCNHYNNSKEDKFSSGLDFLTYIILFLTFVLALPLISATQDVYHQNPLKNWQEYLKDNLKHFVVFSGCVFFYGIKFVRFSNNASRCHSYLNFIIATIIFIISCIVVGIM